MEDQEALQTRAVVGHASHHVQNLVDELLPNRVVATGIVVRSIFLSGDHVLWVEESSVGAGSDFVDNVRLEIAVNGTRDILALSYGLSRDVSYKATQVERSDLNRPVSEKKVLKP